MLDSLGRRLDALAARTPGGDIDPPKRELPWYLDPLPDWLAAVGLRLAWPIALVNLLGTIAGFYYYLPQFERTARLAWPLVPDSPVATLFIACSLVAWRLDYDVPWLHALAFFGCLKLGAWAPFVQLVIEGQGATPLWLYQFLIWSHAAMVVQGFLVPRYADFPIGGVAVALAWYGLNDIVDYFVPIVGDSPHHTVLNAEYVGGAITHDIAAHDLAAGFAVILTMFAVFLSLSARVWFVRSESL